MTRRYVHWDGGALVGEYDYDGALLRRYAHWVGTDVPLLWYEGTTFNSPNYLHADQQGSIIMVSGAGSPTINRYDEYGIPQSTNLGRFQYTGQAYLPEIGMYYYKARFYSPTLGRFMQTDAIGYQDQFNLYEYVGDDPINHTDPTGLYIYALEADRCVTRFGPPSGARAKRPKAGGCRWPRERYCGRSSHV